VPRWNWFGERACSTSSRQERNGLTPRTTPAVTAARERAVVYRSTGDSPEEIVPEVDAQTLDTLAPALYNEVLRPAVELTRKIVVTAAFAVA
jgi:hypothetical protein